MKKFTAIFAISGLSLIGFAQGIINWSGAAGLLRIQTNDTVWSSFVPSYVGGPGGTVGYTVGNAYNAGLGYGGAGYYFDLLTSTVSVNPPVSASELAGWTDTGLSGVNGPGVGKMEQNNASVSAIAANWPAGTASEIVLVGWSANLGNSWATVSNELANWTTIGYAAAGASETYFGVSAIGDIISGTASPGPVLFGNGVGQINSGVAAPMQLDALEVLIPEPGTFALTAFGAAAFLLLRRQK